jgi:O-antigen/teichoic acid export membrane protein
LIRVVKKLFGDNDKLEILSKSLSFLIIKVIGTIFSFLFTLYITNTFGKDVWGLFALAMSIFTIASIIGGLGLNLHLVKYFSQDKNIEDTGIYFLSLIKVLFFSSILALIILLFSETLVTEVFLEPKPELLPYLYWILPSVPFWSVIILSSGIMRAKKMNKLNAFYSMTGRFLILVLLVFLFSIDEIELVLKSYLFSIISLCVICVLHTIFILKKITLNTSKNSWIFLKESIPMMLSSSILVLMSWMDTFIMGIYQNESEVGVYNVAVKITTLSVFSLQAINSILAPKIAKSYAQGDIASCLNIIKFSTKINFFITLGVVGFLVVFNSFLLGLFGEGFQTGVYVLVILCFGQLINSLSGSVGVIMQMIGEQKKYQTFIIVSLVINLILTFILTPLYGGIGAAFATVFSMIFWNIAGAYYLKAQKNIQTYFKPF